MCDPAVLAPVAGKPRRGTRAEWWFTAPRAVQGRRGAASAPRLWWRRGRLAAAAVGAETLDGQRPDAGGRGSRAGAPDVPVEREQRPAVSRLRRLDEGAGAAAHLSALDGRVRVAELSQVEPIPTRFAPRSQLERSL